LNNQIDQNFRKSGIEIAENALKRTALSVTNAQAKIELRVFKRGHQIRHRTVLAKVKKLLDLFTRLGRNPSNAQAVMREVLEKSGYLAWLAEEKNGAEKVENVNALIAMGLGKSMGEFLDDVVLFQKIRMSEEGEEPARSVPSRIAQSAGSHRLR